MTPTEFGAQVKRRLSGAYLFFGEEAYLKDHYLKEAVSAVVKPENEAFNHLVFDFSSYDDMSLDGALASLSAAVEAMPVFAESKLVMIKGVDWIHVPKAVCNSLCASIEKTRDHPETVLIIYTVPEEFDAGNPPKRPSKLYTELTQLAYPVQFDHETPARLAKWVISHFSAQGVTCPPEAAEYLINFAGHDMCNLNNEINKLIAYVKSDGRSSVTTADVAEETVPVVESGDFDFSNALLEGDISRAFALLGEMKKRRDRPEVIIGSISRVYADLNAVKAVSDGSLSQDEAAAALKMNPYKYRMCYRALARRNADALAADLTAVTRADALSKSYSVDSYIIIDRLMIYLMRRR